MLASTQTQWSGPSVPKVPFAKRPGHGSEGRQITVRANFYEIQQLPKAKVYQYDVSIAPDTTTKVELNRKLYSQLLEQHLNSGLGKILPVYDGRANMFTARELPFAQKTFEVRLPPFTPLTGQPASKAAQTSKKDTKPDSVYKIKLNRVAVIDLAELHQFMRGQKAITNNIRQAIMSLDILLRHQPSFLYTTIGRSFYVRDNMVPIPGGLEVWQGYYQSVRPGMGRMYVNIDLSARAFYEAGPLVDVASKFLGFRSPEDLARDMDPKSIKKLERFLKSRMFTVTHRSGHKKGLKISALSELPLKDLFFNKDGQKTKVVEYFQTAYNVHIRYPGLPCVVVNRGSDNKDLYPMEVCKLSPGQKYTRKLDEDQTRAMLAFACKPPGERQRAIQQGLQLLNYRDNDYMKEFGMKVAQEMARVKARVLTPPTITYHNKTTVNPQNGTWNLRNIKVANGMQLESWGVAVLGDERRFPKTSVQAFIREMIIVCEATGLTVTHKEPIISYENPHGDLERSLRTLWKRTGDARKKQPQLLVCLLPTKGLPLYAEIKRISDTLLGVCTQCLQLSKLRDRNLKQYFANVVLKINAKLGGHNSFLGPDQIPLLKNKATIIVGADVTHPPPGDTVRPSIAAVIGSLDRFGSRHGASICVQDHRTERLYDLKKMIIERLKAFFRVSKVKPEQILFYRDGVSEGEFPEVMEIEVKAIRDACKTLGENYKPKITFIIVQKRHHARFFPMRREEGDRTGNCPPGMVIDSDITHPYEYNFYLQAHAGLLGTCRSTLYHVLLDEIGIGANELQQLTFNLCHVYGRCTRSVSLVPAVYYAHLVAARARYHCKGETWTDSSDTSSVHEVGVSGYGMLKSDLEDKMWFM
ncbi:hypothetical protein BGW42_000592 [Actinomortierella wolfii]|nr:hypothetical protein BGW42_000592 [Actinomortierella wolfii]